MTDKELRRMSRRDLLEILIELSKENELLKEQLESANALLQSRRITVETSGSLAEAALRLSGVFEAAQAACDMYCAEMKQRTLEMAGTTADQSKKQI